MGCELPSLRIWHFEASISRSALPSQCISWAPKQAPAHVARQKTSIAGKRRSCMAKRKRKNKKARTSHGLLSRAPANRARPGPVDHGASMQLSTRKLPCRVLCSAGSLVTSPPSDISCLLRLTTNVPKRGQLCAYSRGRAILIRALFFSAAERGKHCSIWRDARRVNRNGAYGRPDDDGVTVCSCMSAKLPVDAK